MGATDKQWGTLGSEGVGADKLKQGISLPCRCVGVDVDPTEKFTKLK